MSGCTLRFTRNSPLRTTLVDETTGDVKYKIKTPIRIARSVTRITKFKPRTETPLHPDVDGNSDSGRNTMKEEKSNSKGGAANEIKTEPLEISDEIARIYWKWFSPNRFIFRGKTATRREFLPKCGKMNGSFTFIGPDGNQYRWALGAMGMNPGRLVTADENKTVVAEFHRPHYFLNKQNARLEVKPAGMDMLDYIIVTFVFVEQTRREREAAAKS